MERQGLLIVHTGEGKGKTTAALGLAIRAFGDGFNVLVLQFIKGSWQYGELKTFELLSKYSGENFGRVQLEPCGLGFSQRNSKDFDKHKKVAQETLQRAKKEMASNQWDMIILDEINYALNFDLIEKNDVLELIREKPKNLHLVFTGRNACQEVIDAADLVTEMKCIKHPFQQGIKAQQGIEF